MRIGITGSQGTGKSTLAASLARILDLPLIKEQAREAANELGIEFLSTLKDQPELGKKFQTACLVCQLQAEAAYPNGFVSDRTTIDNAAYWLKWHAHQWPSEENNRYFTTAINHAKKHYDLIVYVPPEIHPVDDGFRSTDRGYQLEIDTYIKAFLCLADPKSWVTATGSVEERVNQVAQMIGGT